MRVASSVRLPCLALAQSRLAVLKREEDNLREEMERLGAEKRRHVRALKRMWDEVRVCACVCACTRCPAGHGAWMCTHVCM